MPYSITQLVIFAAIVAIAIVAINAMGIMIPTFVITIGWIIVIAIVAVIAIKFLMSLK